MYSNEQQENMLIDAIWCSRLDTINAIKVKIESDKIMY